MLISEVSGMIHYSFLQKYYLVLKIDKTSCYQRHKRK
jgi:hypothetical protein